MAVINGNADNNYMVGTVGDDILNGEGGIDTLEADLGNDTLNGGLDNDYLYGGDGNDVLNGDEGSDELYGEAGDDVLNGGAGNNTLYGGLGADVLYGNTGSGELRGGDGNDIIYAGDNGGRLYGDGGDDILNGGASSDYFYGGLGSDIFNGNDGDDYLEEQNAGNNILNGGKGNDYLSVSFNDSLSTNILNGGEGDDTLITRNSSSTNILDGGQGNDTLTGGDSKDIYIFNRGYGMDSITDSPLYTYYDGSSLYENMNVIKLLEGVAESDIVLNRIGSDLLLFINGTNDQLTISNYFKIEDLFYIYTDISYQNFNIQFADGTTWDKNHILYILNLNYLNGTDSSDTLIGDSADNVLNGLAGADSLYGGEGNDALNGDAGDDELYGEAGNDVLMGGDGNDMLNGDEGSDELYGEAGDDVLNGGAGNNTLYGGLGADVLYGNTGSGELRGGDGNDIIYAGDNGGRLYGDGGDDILNGGASSDYFYGGLGSDIFNGNDGDDYLEEQNAGNNILNGGKGNDYLSVSFNDSLSTNILNGGEGDDTLITRNSSSTNILDGGQGNDTLTGGDSKDIYIFNRGYGMDSITDSPLYTYYDGSSLYENMNVIKLLEGVAESDIVLNRIGSDLLLFINGTNDQLTISNYFKIEDLFYIYTDISYQNFNIQFADGTTWDKNHILYILNLNYLNGTDSSDTLIGDSADNVLNGLAGADSLYGGEGNDALNGDAGDDELYGEAGNDVLMGGDGNDMLNGDEGSDELYGEAGDDVLNGGAGNNTLYGGLGADVLYGNTGSGELRGGDGNDIIYAGDNGGRLYGDGGDDILNGGASSDYFYGGLGSDIFNGNDGDDYLEEQNAGNNILNGGKGNDYLSVSFNDSLSTNILNGGEGDDTLITRNSSSTNILDGGQGNDTLTGGDSKDIYIFNRGYGMDSITDSPLYTYYDGSSLYENMNVIKLLEGVAESDIVLNRIGSDLLLFINGTNDQLTISNYFKIEDLFYIYTDISYQNFNIQFADGTTWDKTAIRNKVLETAIIGTAGNDTLTGGDTNDSISGGGGNDSIDAGAGNDLIEGGTGADTLNGGTGDDTYIADGSDTINETPDGGTDTIQTPDDITLPDNVENLNQTGTGNTTGTGNNLDNTMTGNTGNNQLDGTAGNDTLIGGTGADTLLGGLGDDVLNGSDGNDVFIGGAGNDIISGGRGSDTVYFNLGDGNDIIDNQTDDINTTTDVLVFGQGIALNDLTFMRYNNSADSTVLINGTTDSILVKNYFSQPQYYNNIQLHFADGTVVTYQQLLHMGYVNQGDDSNNALNGFWGNDTLIGGLGDDTLAGGLGTDSYQLGLGDDTVIYHYNQDGGDYVADDLTNEQINAGISDGIDTYKIFNVPNSPVIQFGIEANTERYPNLVLTIGDNNVNLGTQFADDWRDSVSVGWQGIYIENFFTRNPAGSNNGTPVLTAASAQDVFVFYSDDGVTEINRLTGQEVYDTYFAPQNHAPAQTEALAILANGIEDTTYTLFASDLLQGYTDANSDVLSIINLQTTHGTSIDNQNGTYSFSPDANFNGTVNISYQVSDGRGGVVDAVNSFVIDAVNDAPTHTGTQAILANGTENVTYILNATDLLQGFSDIDGGTLTIANLIADHATVINNNNGTYTLTLESNYQGVVVLNYQVIDGQGGILQVPQSFNVVGGNNTTGTTGADILKGGQTDDTYIVNHVRDVVIEADANGGIDTVQSSLSHNLGTNLENLVLVGSGNLSGTGNNLDNTLTGNDGNNRLLAGLGNDTLYGGAGGDTLNGGQGADQMFGGAGNDTFTVENANDLVIEFADEGYDTVNSFVTYTLTANVERLNLENAGGQIDGFGNDLDNTLNGNNAANWLVGGAGNDTLQGKGGADTLEGGLGDDVYYVDNIGDVVTELAGEGTDKVNSTVSYTLTANVEQLYLTGIASLSGTGNGQNNIIYGNSGNNLLSGGAGNDSLNGGAGNDTLDGGQGNDTLVGGLGNDTYLLGVGSGRDTIDNKDSVGNDVLLLGTGVTAEQVWLRQLGNDLEVSIIGTNNSAKIKGWYSGNADSQLDSLQLADGRTLLTNEVQTLVDAMAAFAPPALGQTTLTNEQQAALSIVITTNW